MYNEICARYECDDISPSYETVIDFVKSTIDKAEVTLINNGRRPSLVHSKSMALRAMEEGQHSEFDHDMQVISEASAILRKCLLERRQNPLQFTGSLVDDHSLPVEPRNLIKWTLYGTKEPATSARSTTLIMSAPLYSLVICYTGS